MIGAPISEEFLTLYGSFTSSSSYKPMLYLALAGLPFSFRTVNLKIGVQNTPEYLAINRWGVVPSLRHRGLRPCHGNANEHALRAYNSARVMLLRQQRATRQQLRLGRSAAWIAK